MEYASIAAGIILLFIINKFILAPMRRLVVNTVSGLFCCILSTHTVLSSAWPM